MLMSVNYDVIAVVVLSATWHTFQQLSRNLYRGPRNFQKIFTMRLF